MRIIKKITIVAAVVTLLAVSATGCFGGGSRPLGWSGVAVSGNEVYFGTTTGKLISLNRDTGTVRWQNDDLENAQGIYGTPLVVGDTVYVTTYGGRVHAVNTNGVLKWSSPTVEQVKLPDAVISGLAYSDGRLYYGSTDGKVHALNAETGAPAWDFATGDKIWATPVVDNGVVYVGSFDNKFYALSADDGDELWSFGADGVFSAAAIISGNNVIVGSLDRNIYALDKTTGTEKWRFTGQKWFWAGPLLSGDHIYAPNTDGKVYVLDSATGSKVSEFTLVSSTASNPAVAGDQVVVATESGVVSAIGTANQQIREVIDLKTTLRAPIASFGEVVYLHSQTNETVFALNAVTGARVWEYRIP